jgi:hypothetical protein
LLYAERRIGEQLDKIFQDPIAELTRAKVMWTVEGALRRRNSPELFAIATPNFGKVVFHFQ